MNRLKRTSALLAAAFMVAAVLFATESYAQVKVTVSSEIVKVNGKKMYAHYVKKGETVYSICKAYNITAERLQSDNPIIAQGLKEGQVLYIPYEIEPQGESKSTTLSDTTATAAPQGKYIEHRVRWYEDLDDIALKYDVDKEEIKKLNGLSSDRLRKIKRLKIPVKEEGDNIENKNNGEEENGEDDKNEGEDSNENGDENEEEKSEEVNEFGYRPLPIIENRTRVMTIILPMNASGKVNGNYMDFYAGALMAVNRLKDEGANLKVNVIDMANNVTVEQLIDSEKVKEADLLIGPIRSNILEQMIEYINNRQIGVVSPLDPSADTLVEKSPFIFQAPVSAHNQNLYMADVLTEKYNSVAAPAITIISQQGSKEQEQAQELADLLREREIPCNLLSFKLMGVNHNTFRASIQPSKNNIIAVIDSNEPFVMDMLRNINLLGIYPEKITLYGTPKWKGFESIDMELYFKFNLQICMPYHVDLTDENVKRFISQYRALYKNDPSANSFNGYDIVYLFGNALNQGLAEYVADSWNLSAKEYIEQNLLQQKMLQQNFRFLRKSDQAGYQNRSTSKVSFNHDWSISEQ